MPVKESTAADNVIDFLDAKARKQYPAMPTRLQRAMLWREFERLMKGKSNG